MIVNSEQKKELNSHLNSWECLKSERIKLARKLSEYTNFQQSNIYKLKSIEDNISACYFFFWFTFISYWVCMLSEYLDSIIPIVLFVFICIGFLSEIIDDDKEGCAMFIILSGFFFIAGLLADLISVFITIPCFGLILYLIVTLPSKHINDWKGIINRQNQKIKTIQEKIDHKDNSIDFIKNHIFKLLTIIIKNHLEEVAMADSRSLQDNGLNFVPESFITQILKEETAKGNLQRIKLPNSNVKLYKLTKPNFSKMKVNSQTLIID